MFLPPVSTAIRTSAFSFVGALSDLLYVSQTQRLPSYCVDLICSLYSWWEGFGSSSLATLPLGFSWFYFHLCMQVLHCDLAPGAALEGQGLPLWGPGVEVVQLLGLQGFWQHQVLGGTGGRQLGQQEIQCSRGVWQQVLANTLQYSCLEDPPLWQRSLVGNSLQDRRELDMTEVTQRA